MVQRAVAHQIYITFVAPPAAAASLPLLPQWPGDVCRARRRVLCVEIPREGGGGTMRWSDINWRVIVDGLCNVNGPPALPSLWSIDWITSYDSGGDGERTHEGENF